MLALRLLLVLAFLGLCGEVRAQQAACEPAGGLTFVCGPKNAEDLVRVPGTRWIISSGMADGASFFLIDSKSGAWRPLAFDTKADPAFSRCASAPILKTFQTHGLHIRELGGGVSRLLVVGHGAREAIEVFDVAVVADAPVLTWKGCVAMPQGLAANSVAAFADGSMIATVLLMPGKSFLDSVNKKPTGAVFEWTPGSAGFVQVAGTELPGNNGIETAPDGR